APTMPVMPSGQLDSFSNGTTEIGIAVPAPPTISMLSCARPGATARNASVTNVRMDRAKRYKWTSAAFDGLSLLDTQRVATLAAWRIHVSEKDLQTHETIRSPAGSWVRLQAARVGSQGARRNSAHWRSSRMRPAARRIRRPRARPALAPPLPTAGPQGPAAPTTR